MIFVVITAIVGANQKKSTSDLLSSDLLSLLSIPVAIYLMRILAIFLSALKDLIVSADCNMPELAMQK